MFCVDPWDGLHVIRGDYFGTGENVLFSFQSGELKTYSWKGGSNLHMYQDENIMCVGGSSVEGHFALCL